MKSEPQPHNKVEFSKHEKFKDEPSRLLENFNYELRRKKTLKRYANFNLNLINRVPNEDSQNNIYCCNCIEKKQISHHWSDSEIILLDTRIYQAPGGCKYLKNSSKLGKQTPTFGYYAVIRQYSNIHFWCDKKRKGLLDDPPKSFQKTWTNVFQNFLKS